MWFQLETVSRQLDWPVSQEHWLELRLSRLACLQSLAPPLLQQLALTVLCCLLLLLGEVVCREPRSKWRLAYARGKRAQTPLQGGRASGNLLSQQNALVDMLPHCH